LSMMSSAPSFYLPAFEEFVDNFKRECVQKGIKIKDGSLFFYQKYHKLFSHITANAKLIDVRI